jgi:CRP/FNR family transcriptional regulator
MTRTSFLNLFCGETCEAGELLRMATRVTMPAKKTIFSEGDQADGVFGLSEGTVRLFKLMPDGRRQILALALPGEFLEMPMIEQHRHSASTIGEVELYRFRRDELVAYIQSTPKLMSLLVEVTTRQLISTQDQLLMLGKGSAEERMLFFLARWRERVALLKQVQEYLPLPMWREDIADLLGLTIETVSRTLSKLEEKGVIRIVPKGVVLMRDSLTSRRGGPK